MLTFLLVVGVLGYIAWPYYTVYRLDRALVENDEQELKKRIDLDAIRLQFKQKLDRQIEGVAEGYDNPILKFLRGGVKELGSTSMEAIDYEWLRETIRTAQISRRARPHPLLGRFSFAFFESPGRFLIRAGELGENPVHLYMTFQPWQWRVTALFG